MLRNDSEIIQLNGIGLFTKEIVEDSLEMREASEDTIEDTIDNSINTNALKHDNDYDLCPKGRVLSGSRSLNGPVAACHFRWCPEMKVVQLLM